MSRDSGPVTVCVINLKGGVGKSTISAMLARHGYRERKLNVLAIDLDPQANLSQGLMGEGYKQFLEQKRPSVVEIFNGYLPPTAESPNVAVLPESPPVEQIAKANDRTLDLIPSRFDFADNLREAIRPDPRRLARYLTAKFRQKDLVLIDCAPTESILTTAAYHASRYVLVPVKPEYFATVGFPLLNESLANFRTQNRGHQIDVIGVVINNSFYHGGNDGGPEKSRAMKEIRKEAAKNWWPIYRNEILHSRGFPKMMRGDNSYRGNAQYFPTFAEEFFRSIKL